MRFTFAALEHIVMEDPLLTKVEAYLRDVGQDDLADRLNKFQQDAGAKVFNDIGNGEDADTQVTSDIDRVIDFIDGEALETSDPIVGAFEGLTEERGQVFTEIVPIIERRGGALNLEYQSFLNGLQLLTAPKSSAAPSVKAVIKPI